MARLEPSSHEKLLKLAHQRAVDGKSGLAASVAKLCLDSHVELTPEELALTYDILRKLIGHVEVQIRRYVADYLAERVDLPADLLTFLTHDVINVAYPILVHSRQLSDEELIEIGKSMGQRHRIAVAKRAGLSETVSAYLVEDGDTEVLSQLLKNFSATFSVDSLTKTALKSVQEPDLQSLLLQRRDLPPELAKRMYAWVGEALRNHIVRNFEIDSDLLDDSVTAAIARVMDADDDESFWSDPSGANYDQRLIGALESGGRPGFINTFCKISGVETLIARERLADSSATGLATACKAYDMSRDQFCTVLGHIFGHSRMTALAADGDLAKALNFFDRLDVASARMIVRLWRDTPDTLPRAS